MTSAKDNSLSGVKSALMAGATLDVVWNSDWAMENMTWDEEFSTALTYAVKNDNFEMLNLLLKSGATLNTRRLPMDEAAEKGSLAMVEHLIKLGARVNGWKDQRHWPLHLLVTRRAGISGMSKAEYRKYIKEQGWPTKKNEIEEQIRQHVDADTYLKILEALLEAGAEPNAPWDNGITMLMEGGIKTSKLLLKYGADVHQRDVHGWTAFFRARSPEKIKLLVEHGGDINARAEPEDPDSPFGLDTPLQSALMSSSWKPIELVHAFLEAGADPKIKDGNGLNSLAYCFSVESFKLIQGYGLDPNEPLPDAKTFLHNLASRSHVPRIGFEKEIAFFEFLLELGIDINAQDDEGKTMLHYAADSTPYDEWASSFAMLVAKGADTSIKDNEGKRAFDYAAKSLTKIRAILK